MMSYTYLSYISDDYLLFCIKTLFDSYRVAENKITLKKFYSNKIDPIKLTFDKKFRKLSEQELIESEISRQIDKSINNAIGTFHEMILGGIDGYERGDKSGYDIRALDNTLFADIKNKHNTMNSSSSESLYQKLQRFAKANKDATCYWVAIWATQSYDELWSGTINKKYYKHERVRRISGDRFYELLTGKQNALIELYEALPLAIDDFLSNTTEHKISASSALKELTDKTEISENTILDQMTLDNFKYYLGFDRLE